jgi:hypothetical protein
MLEGACACQASRPRRGTHTEQDDLRAVVTMNDATARRPESIRRPVGQRYDHI